MFPLPTPLKNGHIKLYFWFPNKKIWTQPSLLPCSLDILQHERNNDTSSHNIAMFTNRNLSKLSGPVKATEVRRCFSLYMYCKLKTARVMLNHGMVSTFSMWETQIFVVYNAWHDTTWYSVLSWDYNSFFLNSGIKSLPIFLSFIG